MSVPYPRFQADYDAALATFEYTGGAVRLAEPHENAALLRRVWGHLEKDPYTIPFGPWSLKPSAPLGDSHETELPPSAPPWVYRYGTARAATGSRYAVLVTRVHGDVASREGGPMIITVLSPWQDSHAVAETGYLDPSYVAEKLTGGRARAGALHGGDLAAITRLIGILLGRETEVPADVSACVWKNPWTDSGDRGAAQVDHDRQCHPDHDHVWADSTYDWEQAGVDHIAPGDGIKATPRPVTVRRCQVCALAPADVKTCQ